MKAYAFVGRFYYTMPTDLNVRSYGHEVQVLTYNFDQTSVAQDPAVIGHNTPFVQGGTSAVPHDAGLKGIYQDEFTIGVEKALDPTLSIGIKGTYRTLGRTVEDRCDLDYNDPLAQDNTCAIFNPGSASVANGGIKSCNGSENPTDPTAGVCDLPAIAVGSTGPAPLVHETVWLRGAGPAPGLLVTENVAGYCTSPARSTCSRSPGMSTSSPSDTASRRSSRIRPARCRGAFRPGRRGSAPRPSRRPSGGCGRARADPARGRGARDHRRRCRRADRPTRRGRWRACSARRGTRARSS